MTFDLERILESKRALRRNLASRPVAEKLAMLDALRDRLRAIREAATGDESILPQHRNWRESGSNMQDEDGAASPTTGPGSGQS